jgi:hypothetical protein
MFESFFFLWFTFCIVIYAMCEWGSYKCGLLVEKFLFWTRNALTLDAMKRQPNNHSDVNQRVQVQYRINNDKLAFDDNATCMKQIYDTVQRGSTTSSWL